MKLIILNYLVSRNLVPLLRSSMDFRPPEWRTSSKSREGAVCSRRYCACKLHCSFGKPSGKCHVDCQWGTGRLIDVKTSKRCLALPISCRCNSNQYVTALVCYISFSSMNFIDLLSIKPSVQ